MPDKEAEDTTEQAPAKSKKPVMIAGIIGGMVVVQAIGAFVVFKLVSNNGPLEAAGIVMPDGHGDQAHEDEGKDTAELLIAKLQCPHTNTGKLYVIMMTVYATVPKHLLGHKEEAGGGHGSSAKDGESEPHGIEAVLKENEATIKHRMRTIIASSDPGTLCLVRSEKPDSGLLTLRRQFKSVLEEVVGKGKIKDVLIPDYMPRPIE